MKHEHNFDKKDIANKKAQEAVDLMDERIANNLVKEKNKEKHNPGKHHKSEEEVYESPEEFGANDKSYDELQEQDDSDDSNDDSADEYRPENKLKGNKKSEKEDMKKDWILFVALAIIIISVLAVVLLIKYTDRTPKIETYTYNGFEFIKLGDLWYFDIQPSPGKIVHVPIHFTPKDLKNISVVGNLDSEKFNQPEIYITFDPGDDKDLKFTALAAGELGLSMSQGILAVPIAACTKNETEACASRPIKDCSSPDPVIYLKTSDNAKVTMNGTCIIVEGKDYDLIRSTDRLLLWWYAVMRE